MEAISVFNGGGLNYPDGSVLFREVFLNNTLDVLGCHLFDLVKLGEKIAPVAGKDLVIGQLPGQAVIGIQAADQGGAGTCLGLLEVFRGDRFRFKPLNFF